MTIGEHLREAARVDPSARRELVGPTLPPIAERAWSVFGDLHACRPLSAQGITPISYVEMDAYCRMTGQQLAPLDVFLVRTIDEAFVAEWAIQANPRADDDAGTSLPDLPES
jgi:hypothetical protein